MEMLLAEGTVALVLRERLPGLDTATLVRLIAGFGYPELTWKIAISRHQTPASSLAYVQRLHAQQVPVEIFTDTWGRERHTAMDEAARFGFLSVVQFLHTHNIGGCSRYAMDYAAQHGHLEIIQFLHENRTEGCSSKAMDEASRYNRLDIVRYLHEVVHADVTSMAWRIAAINGNLLMLQYLDTVQKLLPEEKRTQQFRLRSGREWRVDVVIFLHKNGYPGDLVEAMNGAAAAGDLELVQYFHANSTDGCTTTNAMDWAASNGHLDVVQFLHENRPEGCTTGAMDCAASHGHLDVVQYLHDHRTEGCTTFAMDGAARGGHLKVVQFLHATRHEGCTTNAMDQAAANGQLEIVQYLQEHRTEGCTRQAMTQAAIYDHLDVVQFLHDHRTEGCDDAAGSQCINWRRLEMIQYLHKNRLVHLQVKDFVDVMCGDEKMVQFLYDNCVALSGDQRLPTILAALHEAIRSKRLDRVQYLYSKKQPGDVFNSKSMDLAARLGFLDIVQYLHFQGHEGWTTTTMDGAAWYGHLSVVQFLHENRSEGCTTAMDDAARCGHLSVVQFLHQNRCDNCCLRRAATRANVNCYKSVSEYLDAFVCNCVECKNST